MAKAIRNIFKNDNFLLSECNDGFWLYDYEIGMNLSMRAKTEQDAFIEALTYYQNRLKQIKKDYKDLNNKVEAFVSQFNNEEY